LSAICIVQIVLQRRHTFIMRMTCRRVVMVNEVTYVDSQCIVYLQC